MRNSSHNRRYGSKDEIKSSTFEFKDSKQDQYVKSDQSNGAQISMKNSSNNHDDASIDGNSPNNHNSADNNNRNSSNNQIYNSLDRFGFKISTENNSKMRISDHLQGNAEKLKKVDSIEKINEIDEENKSKLNRIDKENEKNKERLNESETRNSTTSESVKSIQKDTPDSKIKNESNRKDAMPESTVQDLSESNDNNLIHSQPTIDNKVIDKLVSIIHKGDIEMDERLLLILEKTIQKLSISSDPFTCKVCVNISLCLNYIKDFIELKKIIK